MQYIIKNGDTKIIISALSLGEAKHRAINICDHSKKITVKEYEGQTNENI
tara:strand:+ start:150 stop:299 length:150 start_codon:yes stop_codon:yes gene_type:complete